MLNIAFFLGELQLDSQRKVLEGILKGAKKDGNNIFVYSLTLTLDERFNDGEYFVAQHDNFDVYDGFIIYSESMYSEKVRADLLDKLIKLGKPCASIDCQIDGMINVSSNNEGAMRALAKHMIEEHDIRTVNYISGPEDSIDAVVRKRVICEEMELHNLPIDEKRFFTGDYYARSGRNAVDYFDSIGLLHADAYICANDQMALGAFYRLQELGISVPEDTLMSGFDDIFEAATHYPRITSVMRHEEKLGESAYDCVVRKIMGIPTDDYKEVPFKVICAESCGCTIESPISSKSVIHKYTGKSLQETRYAEMINDFSAEVTGVINYDEIGQQLRKYVPSLGGDAFATYLFEKENDPSVINFGMTYNSKGFSVKTEYKKKSMLEDIDSSTGGHLYVINSIHFGDKCYGYTIIRNSNMPTRSEFYRIFAITLGSTIEHINNVMQMKKMIKRLDEMWVFDPMTHLYNRAGFFKYADEIKQSAKIKEKDLFIIFLDMDGLKKVNDVLGHEMGDRLICDMADILRKCRDKEELLMRYGGDEFVIFGEGYDEEYMESYVERIRKAMAEQNAKGDKAYIIDASIGYSIVSYDDERELNNLIEIADQKMYVEKREKHKRREA